MNKQFCSIPLIDKMMQIDSLDGGNQNFPVSVSFNVINISQAQRIINRSLLLHARMNTLKEKIEKLYGVEQTQKLMNNFDDIVSYSDKVLEHGTGETFEEYFLKLESFCGQIENIIKMIRYYYALFEGTL